MSSYHDAVDYRVDADDAAVHSRWNNDLDPVRTIEPGDVVRLECRDATSGQLDPDSVGGTS